MTMTEQAPATPPTAADPPGPVPRRRLGSRLSAGHLFMILAALVAVLLNYSVLRARDDTVRVAVAAAELSVGQPVTAAAFTFTDVRVPDVLLVHLVTPESLAELDGWVTSTAITAGELVRAGDLQPPSAPEAQRAMSIPIDPAHAVAGALRRGDRVDVIEVTDRTAAYLLTDAEVLDVPDANPSGIQAGLRTFSVTVAVDDETALRLAVAIRSGQLEIVRSTGSAQAQHERVDLADVEPDGTADELTDDPAAGGGADNDPGVEG